MRVWMFGVLAACTTTTHVVRPSTDIVDAVGSTCPAGTDAQRAVELVDTGAVIETGKNASCTVDEVLSVDDSYMQHAGTRCCFPVRCDATVTAADSAMLFQATCFAGPCATIDLGGYSPAIARDKLAAHLPGCMLDPASPDPVDVPAVSCWYVVHESETCYSGGLGS